MSKEIPFFICAIFLMIISGVLLTTKYFFLAPGVPLALIGLIILYRHPEYGILLILFLVPFERLFNDGLSGGSKLFTGAKLVGIALIAIIGLKLLTKEIPLRSLKSPLWWPILLLVFSFSLGTLQSPYFDLSLNSSRQLLTAIAIFFITLGIKERINIRHLMCVIVVSAAITSLLSLITSSNSVEGRAIGLLTDPNYFALLLTIAAPFAVYLLLDEKIALMRILWLSLLGLILLAFQETLSRSGMVVISITFCLLGFHYKDKLKALSGAKIALMLIAGILVTITTFSTMPREYRERILSLASLTSDTRSFEDQSLGRRASYIVVGLKAFKENPILGLGPGTFPVEYAKSGYAAAYLLGQEDVTRNLFRRGHNTYLESLTETGLVGFSAFCGIVLMGLAQFIRARKQAMVSDQLDQAAVITYTGIAFFAISLFLMFLTGINNKHFWIFLALSTRFIQQFQSPPQSTSLSKTV